MVLLWSPVNEDTIIYLSRSECGGPLRHTFLTLVMYDHNYTDAWNQKLMPMSVIYRIARFASAPKGKLFFFKMVHKKRCKNFQEVIETKKCKPIVSFI